MIYLVATHSHLVAVELDDAWKLKSQKVVDGGYHYGIAAVPAPRGANNGQTRVAAYRGGDSLMEQSSPAFPVYEHDGMAFTHVDTINVADIGDVHQILFGNGGLYITNCWRNSLIFHDLATGAEDVYYFEGTHLNRNNINSLSWTDDRLCVMLHNRRRKESEIAVLSHEPGEGFALQHRLSLWHDSCHNVAIDDGLLFYNASRVNKLIIVDLSQDRIVDMFDFSILNAALPSAAGHTKGLSVGTDHIVVGVSEKTATLNRPSSAGYLGVIDRNRLAVEEVVDLNAALQPRNVGNVNEVHFLAGSVDRGTDNGPDWSALRLARRQPLPHAFKRAKGMLLTPALRYLKKEGAWKQDQRYGPEGTPTSATPRNNRR